MTKLNETYKKISEILITLNLIESTIKNIITAYVKPEKEYFFREYMLHNSYFPIGTKVAIIDHICKRVKFKNDFDNNLRRLIKIRNTVAHSDSLVTLKDFITIDETRDSIEKIYNAIEIEDSPLIASSPDKKLKNVSLNDLYTEFIQTATIVLDKLQELRDKIDEQT